MLLYILSQWREIGRAFSGRQARYGTLAAASVLVVLGILVGDQLPRHAAEQALGPDRGQAVQPVGPDPQRAAGARRAAEDPRCSRGPRTSSASATGSRNTSTSRSRSRPSTSIRTSSRRWPSSTSESSLGTVVFEYKGRTERVTSDAEQDLTNGIIKVIPGQQRKVYFTQGHGEKDTGGVRARGYNAIATRARPRELHRRQAGARAAGTIPPTPPSWSSPARRPTSSRRRSSAEDVSGQGRQAAAACSIRRRRPTRRR